MKSWLVLVTALLVLLAPSVTASSDASWRSSPIVQELQRDFEEALVFQQRILSGEVSRVGLSSEMLGWIIDFGTSYIQAHPQADMTVFVQQWIEPFLTDSPAILRSKAYRFLAQRAVLEGRWDPQVDAFLDASPVSGTTLHTQSALLTFLMPTFADSPEWQRAARRFMSRVAPDGRVSMSAHSLAAAANVYFALNAFDSQLSEKLFGPVEFPMSATNVSSLLRDTMRQIALAGLAAEGWKLTAGGFAEVGAMEKRTIVSQAMQNAMLIAFGDAEPW